MMEKKIKFSDQPKKVKILYASVIGVLCVTAIVIGIASAASKKNTLPEGGEPTVNLPDDDLVVNPDDELADGGSSVETPSEEQKPSKFTMVSPVVGKITKGHSIDTPVFSTTLNEWRVHTGIDIASEEGAKVYAAADGSVTKVYTDPIMGKTIEIDHGNDIVSIYSNLASTGIEVKVGDEVKSGDLIGVVGDTSLSELADEAHLHFSVKLSGVSVNPLDYISEDSKSASLGISEI